MRTITTPTRDFRLRKIFSGSDNLERDFEIDPELPKSIPEHNLISAIILQAIHDLFAPRPERSRYWSNSAFLEASKEWLLEKRKAEAWLFRDSPGSWLRKYCEMLGLEVDELRTQLLARKEEKRYA